MPHNEPYIFVWEMTDPAVLAHRFKLPVKLPPFTALTVGPGQKGLVFLGNDIFVLPNAGLNLITGDRIHTLAEGMGLMQENYTDVVLPYNSQITLFDVRQKIWHAAPIDARCADGGHVTFNLSLSYCVQDVEKLDRSGATYQPCGEASEIRQDDPRLSEAFRRAEADVTQKLLARAAAAPSPEEAKQLFSAPALRQEIRAICDGHLMPMGLAVIQPHLTPAHATCPYCQKTLSLTEIRRRFCSNTDDDGQPQKGCNRQLHACPSCQTIVGADRTTCPTCGDELLFCATPGCRTFRKVERGRFCPVCKRACYPQPDWEFHVTD